MNLFYFTGLEITSFEKLTIIILFQKLRMNIMLI